MTSLLTFTADAYCLDCHAALNESGTADRCTECHDRHVIGSSVRAFRLYTESGFPVHALAALSHGDESSDHADRRTLREKVAALLAGASERSTLYITGSVGTGKTVEASRAGLAVILAGGGAQFVTSSDYLARIRSAYGDNSRDGAEQIVGRALAAPLLVLDDLGVERATAHAVARLLELIDSRYRAMKPMIITSNFSLSELAAHLAGGASAEERADARENTRRLCDRLQEIATGAHLEGTSHRKTARPDTWAKLRRIVAAVDAEPQKERAGAMSPELEQFMRRGSSIGVAKPADASKAWRAELVEIMPNLSELSAVVDLDIFASRNTRGAR